MDSAFAGIVDYAGLFPPASCSMIDAVRNYDEYRHSPDRWMLGGFVVAASRLQEFAAALRANQVAVSRRDPWPLSIVLGAVLPAELALVAAFHAEWDEHGVIANTLEFKVSSPGQMRTVGEQIPHLFRRFFEVPIAPPYSDLIREIAACKGYAKLRTGGTQPELFPTAESITLFLLSAARYKVAFKATAGLHHPFAGDFPLTYAADAERHRMFGFVNLLLAITEIRRSGEGELAQAILEDADQRHFRRIGHDIAWRDERYSSAELTSAHEEAFLSFGSCSFREPHDELGIRSAA